MKFPQNFAQLKQMKWGIFYETNSRRKLSNVKPHIKDKLAR